MGGVGDLGDEGNHDREHRLLERESRAELARGRYGSVDHMSMSSRPDVSSRRMPSYEFATMQLAIVIPCFNEAEVLEETASRLSKLLERLVSSGTVNDASRIYFVDDGSKDASWKLIGSLAGQLPWIKGVKLSRNCGHQIAVLAGLLTIPGDVLISMDADLQDDPGAIEQMLEAHRNGSEIVYGVRRRRKTDAVLKRVTAEHYYRLLRLLGVDIVLNHADYRLMGRRALTALAEYEEVNVFLRGIIPQLGFPTSIVYYDRGERYAGESKYPLRKMLTLAWNGITSFSPAPLRFITGAGLVIAVGSLGLSVWALIVRLGGYYSVPGWASSVVAIYLLGGLQLFSIGLIGEYLAKIYLEVKRRPRFIIEETV